MNTGYLIVKIWQIIFIVTVFTSCQWTGQVSHSVGEITPHLVQAIKEYLPGAHARARASLRAILRREAEESRYHSGQDESPAYKHVQNFLGSSPMGKQLSYPAIAQIFCLKLVQKRFKLDKHQMLRLYKELDDILLPNKYTLGADSKLPRPFPHVCPFPQSYRCDADHKYRSYNGACNNLRNPMWGKSFQPFGRFLAADYADGITEPRRSKTDYQLPSPRLVSITLFKDIDLPNYSNAFLLMNFGQFLDHDMDRMAIAKLSMDAEGYGSIEDVVCGFDGCGTGSRSCFPIHVPSFDPDFRHQKCLKFVRTSETVNTECKPGPREQLNQLTSYLDLSHVYGSTKEEAEELKIRNTRRGRMRMTPHPYSYHLKPLLPRKRNSECRDTNSTIMCFHAGDERVNEVTGLTVLHTFYAREHNRIEEGLHRLNSHWDGETLYQETRRIMVASWQYIVYNEFLPIILGPELINRYSLNLQGYGYSDGYDESVRPDIRNVFATAAFRFGHTLIDGVLKRADNRYIPHAQYDLSTLFNRPYEVYNYGQGGCDSLMRGMMYHHTQSYDRFFTKQLTRHLFAEDPPHGLGTDLTSLNIQRGRDHGVPGYNYWREWCGLRRAYSFDDLSAEIPDPFARQKLARLYDHVDDVDIFVGGVLEKRVPGGVVGPTFGCIIARQFQVLRQGDRFWFENRKGNPHPFSFDQLREIRKSTLARLICDNGDHITHIQPESLKLPLSHIIRMTSRSNHFDLHEVIQSYNGKRNERGPCHLLPRVDLRPWRERPYSRRQTHPFFEGFEEHDDFL